ncbi:hypothetical protein PGT21_009700 [Puccinia graminis f. sp. tritici]|uniref:Uncharacterized protein n=1 Tax=Puccinia graminis f. sp. tritici TaxID=56615 RepID=A0A5B0PX83_PUCGR|nr:hypothetical protein PGT21_009700 [Puccinia graminis f. sp. tritici]
MELRLVAYRKWRPGLFLCLSFRYGLCVASSNVCTLPTFANLLMTITNAFIISPDAETRYVSDDPSRGYGLLQRCVFEPHAQISYLLMDLAGEYVALPISSIVHCLSPSPPTS